MQKNNRIQRQGAETDHTRKLDGTGRTQDDKVATHQLRILPGRKTKSHITPGDTHGNRGMKQHTCACHEECEKHQRTKEDEILQQTVCYCERCNVEHRRHSTETPCYTHEYFSHKGGHEAEELKCNDCGDPNDDFYIRTIVTRVNVIGTYHDGTVNKRITKERDTQCCTRCYYRAEARMVQQIFWEGTLE